MMNPKVPAGRNDGHEMDYSQITDKIYIGSDLCKGNVCPIHSAEFKKLGICLEINLTAEKKEIPPDAINGYLWMPVVDGYPPSEDQLDLGTSVIDQSLKNNNTIYLHCKNGHGRSPTLLAAYFVRFLGMSVEEAISKVKEKRSEVHVEEMQKKALEDYYKKWSK